MHWASEVFSDEVGDLRLMGGLRRGKRIGIKQASLKATKESDKGV